MGKHWGSLFFAMPNEFDRELVARVPEILQSRNRSDWRRLEIAHHQLSAYSNSRMGQQHRVRAKRQRRKAYLERKRVAASRPRRPAAKSRTKKSPAPATTADSSAVTTAEEASAAS
jgi:hypothetical protein